MKKVSTLLVTALIPLFAAMMTQSCAGGGDAQSTDGSGGDSGDNGSGGSDGSGGSGNGSGGTTSSSSGGKVGSGGTTSSSSGGTTSSSSGGKVGSGGTSSSGGKVGSGGTSSSGGKVGSGGTTVSSSGGTTGGTASGGTTGGSCTADSTISTNGLAVSGTWMGYAYTYMGSAPSSVTPVCGTTGSCFSAALKQLCVSGSVGPDSTYNASAGFGWNIDGPDTTTAKPIAPGGTGLAYNVVGLTTAMRFQIEDGAGVQYCANVTAVPSGTIPWAMFSQKCYATPPGDKYAPTTTLAKVGIVVPSNSGTATAFCFCVVSLGPA